MKTYALRLLLVLAFTPVALPLFAQETQFDQQSARIRQIVLSRGDDPGAVAYLVQLTREMPSADAALVYRQLADDYLQQAKYNTAGEVLRQLVDRYPEETAAADSVLTLARLYASSEVAHTQQITRPTSEGNEGLATYALHLGSQARMQNAKLAENPKLAFQCAVAARSAGRAGHAQGFLTPLEHNPRAQEWHHRARAEAWLGTDRQEESPLAVRHCRLISKRPHLDGKLLEPFWQTVVTVAHDHATWLQLKRDQEFLYFAVRCEKQPGIFYEPDNRPRSYDADLSQHDHVRLRIDLDRDYATYFELAIDHRGWTADRCWLAKNWNPRWFVAANQDATHWTLEAAIPWKELTRQSPSTGAAGAISITRFVPGEKPEEADFELLLFD